MFSTFFIRRPIFASVVSFFVVVLGIVSIPALPIEQTPNITPPTVQVTTSYPGASPEVLSQTIAMPIEKEVNGVDDMIYMSSMCSNDGRYTLTVTFEVGTDIDMATVLVQNRVSIAEPKLPEEVKRQGVTTQKQSTNMVMVVSLLADDTELYDDIYQSNYIDTKLVDSLKRVPGVGGVTVFGAKNYGMRIWLDPARLKARGLTTGDVLAAIREQNVQVAAGQIGAPPTTEGTEFTYTINTLGRLSEVSEYEDMIVKVGADGGLVRVRDIARVELGAETYGQSMTFDRNTSIGMGIFQLPGANALSIAEGVDAMMQELSGSFPPGLRYTIAYDSTNFIEASINEVFSSLLIAVLLVVLTVYVFLQDLRTTLIPSATIPVSLIGTLFVMNALGMSINTLSLFGIVLAIGIVVDDAIVVVENTMRIIDEEKLSAKEATEKAMGQITGPVVATTLVLLAVFVPTAMMAGITGRLYQQFAITISVATVFSSINALTLSPALCGILLRPTPEKRNFFFRGFERVLDASRTGYVSLVTRLVRRLAIAIVLYIAFVAGAVFGFMEVPSGFLPDEDQGFVFVNAMLPEGASLERSQAVLDDLERQILEIPGVDHTIGIGGYSFLDGVNTANAASVIVTLRPWEERTDVEQGIAAILGRANGFLHSYQPAAGFAFSPPPISGLGNAGGFEYMLEDRGGVGSLQLEQFANDLVLGGFQDPVLGRMNNSFRASTPQLFLELDREKVKRLGIPLQNVFDTLQANLGSAYANDFNAFGRTYKVMVQADHEYRDRVDDIVRLEVRNAAGDMVPLATLLTVDDQVGPRTIFRYNNYPSATITGAANPGYSSGQAIEAMAALSDRTLSSSMGYEWSGTTYQELKAGSDTIKTFGLALLFVFLFLAAQYESWATPLAVLLSVPFAILGGVALTAARGMDNNVYTQIGFVMLIGLAAKNAIMIVEFAKQKVDEEGVSFADAAIEGARLRYRAILMTAFSFLLGVIPLVIASGAGAGSRRSLGTAVFGGMLVATIVGIFWIPVLYVFVMKVCSRKPSPAATNASSPPSAAPAVEA